MKLRKIKAFFFRGSDHFQRMLVIFIALLILNIFAIPVVYDLAHKNSGAENLYTASGKISSGETAHPASQDSSKTKKTVNASSASAYPFHKSSRDKNKNGIDDRTDMLQGAKKFLATKPQYKSKYYTGGYPTDHYGVCTDVVAAGFTNAGYDLRKMINSDVIAHPESYPEINVPDEDIDFRRVENQLVYFRRHLISLPTNVYKTDQWQGGDIVVFRGHIGVVSDKRNAKGIPYLLHLSYKGQKIYEVDELEKRYHSKKPIIGHFRLN